MLATRMRQAAAGANETVPVAPSGLTATPVSTSQVDLSWTDNATNETGYKIYRSDNGGAYGLIDTISADSTSYSDTTITAGAAHFYKVASYNGAGEAESNAAGTNTLLLGLSHYWKLDESSGTREDSAGSADLTGSNGASTGIINNGVLADGTNFLGVSGLANEDIEANGCTVWGWIKASSFTGSKGIIQNGTLSDMNLYVNSSTSIRFRINDSVSGTTQAIATVALSVDTWYMLWGRYNPATKQAEVGLNDGSGTLGTAITNGAKPITSFQVLRNAATVTIVGVVDEVGFALRKYTDDEISSLYSGGAGNQYPFY